MTLDELYKALRDLDNIMEDAVLLINKRATIAQQSIFEAMLAEADKLRIEDGLIDPTQDLTYRFAKLEAKMTEILNVQYLRKISPYFSTYKTVQEQVISLQKGYNDIEVDAEKLTPQRQAIYTQAKYFMTTGLADAYIQPAKYLMMQQATAGVGIEQMRTALKQWNEGTLPKGKTASNQHAPRLQAYSTQLARDTIYTYQGALQNTIKEEYNLNRFIYVGGLVEDSRPLCRHLVGLRRKIDLIEMPELIKKYPQGLKPNTTHKNFLQLRGGYSCNHTCMVVR